MAIVAQLRARDREHDARGWVESWRSFPSRVMDARMVAPSPLVAIAEDRVTSGRGFGRHSPQLLSRDPNGDVT